MQQFFIQQTKQKNQSSVWKKVSEEDFFRVMADVAYSPSYNKDGTLRTSGFGNSSLCGRVTSGDVEEIEKIYGTKDPDFVTVFKTGEIK